MSAARNCEDSPPQNRLGRYIPQHDENVDDIAHKSETPLQIPMPQSQLPGTGQTQLPGTANTSCNICTAGTPITPNDYPPVNEKGRHEMKAGRPNLYMLPRSICLNKKVPLIINAASEEGLEGLERGSNQQPLTQEVVNRGLTQVQIIRSVRKCLLSTMRSSAPTHMRWVCLICGEKFEEKAVLACNHFFHTHCLRNRLSETNECPKCYTPAYSCRGFINTI